MTSRKIPESAVENLVSDLASKQDKSNLSTALLESLGYTMGGATPRNFVCESATSIRVKAPWYCKLDGFGWFSLSQDVVIPMTDLAANTEYYIYLCNKNDVWSFETSSNSTIPDGFTASNSRKVAWFHTIGANIETGLTYDWGGATGLAHPYSGMTAGSIDPNSVWCRSFRPKTPLSFFNYVEPIDLAVSVFLQSGTGTSTQFVANATITDARCYGNHLEDLLSVDCRMLTEYEFAMSADGSNQKTNITGSVDPVTTGFHKDTAGRSMISRFGLWSCCGEIWQFLQSPCASLNSKWQNIDGGKGDTFGALAVLLGGGKWNDSSHCGSRALYGAGSRATLDTDYSVRASSPILRGYEWA